MMIIKVPIPTPAIFPEVVWQLAIVRKDRSVINE
jgi:hypothetical protein